MLTKHNKLTPCDRAHTLHVGEAERVLPHQRLRLVLHHGDTKATLVPKQNSPKGAPAWLKEYIYDPQEVADSHTDGADQIEGLSIMDIIRRLNVTIERLLSVTVIMFVLARRDLAKLCNLGAEDL